MSESPKRKHRATGRKPPGGKRPGAGRPPGTFNALPRGAVAAVTALSLRVPENAPPEAKVLADRAFQRVVDVLEEQVYFQSAPSVLKAATIIREEICGPVAQKHEVAGKDGQALSITIDMGAAKWTE